MTQCNLHTFSPSLLLVQSLFFSRTTCCILGFECLSLQSLLRYFLSLSPDFYDGRVNLGFPHSRTIIRLPFPSLPSSSRHPRTGGIRGKKKHRRLIPLDKLAVDYQPYKTIGGLGQETLREIARISSLLS